MSYAQNGVNGLVNGNYARNTGDRYEEDSYDGGSMVSSRARRAGGYGGFLNDNLPPPSEDSPPIPSRHRLHDGNALGRYGPDDPDRSLRGNASSDRSRSRDRVGRDTANERTYGVGPGARQIQGQSWASARFVSQRLGRSVFASAYEID